MTVPIVGAEDYPSDQSVKVNGPPGTGKTSQGLARVVDLIDTYDVAVEDVAWVTYRRSLAEDVLERFVKEDIVDRSELDDAHRGRTKQIGTVHAVARRIGASEMRQLDAVSWLDKQDFMLSTYSMPMSTSNTQTPDFGDLLFSVYHWLVNNEMEMGREFECPLYPQLEDAWASHPTFAEFTEAWTEYKADHGLVDFHEYLVEARDRGWTPDAEVIVVDEFHDAYPLMDSVCDQWLNAAETAIVLGDPQQVVNSHEGASPRFFETVDLPEIQLDKTWRVPESIWETATSVLEGHHDPHTPKFDDSIEGTLYEIHPPEIDHIKDTGEWVTTTDEYGTPDDIYRRFSSEDKSVMYLTRTQQMARGVSACLRAAGVIHRSQMGAWGDDDRRRHLFNALQRLSQGARELWSAEVGWLLRHTPASLIYGSRDTVDALAGEWLSVDRPVDVDQLKELVVPKFWEGVSAESLVHREGDRALNTDVLASAVAFHSEPTVSIKELQEDPEETGLASYPNVCTIHASKGSESDVAVVFDGITSTISDAVRQDPSVEANEDRVWYVALTRAASDVVVCRDVFWWTDSYLPWTVSAAATDSGLPAVNGGDDQ